MKFPSRRRRKAKAVVEALVRERKGEHEKKLEVAKLRENLVHEEFDVDVKHVYDFRYPFSYTRWLYRTVVPSRRSNTNDCSYHTTVVVQKEVQFSAHVPRCCTA